MPTDLQKSMVAPERFLVAHPFNPVYLLPLVELVGGSKTSPGSIEVARKFFTYIGMHALHVRKEIPWFTSQDRCKRRSGAKFCTW